jgi:glyoxylase-like metal-dependent hydrolase (beta-lactamase superfamily II)
VRSWRSALLNLGGGVDRILISLDGHYDRTLGARLLDCTVIGHEKLLQDFRNRPVNFKTQGTETGSEWELHNGLGTIRWAPPEITFSHNLNLNWNDSPLVLESRPGPAVGAIWAAVPGQKVVFVGDAVVPGQPPFLASCDLPAWVESLDVLLGSDYRDFLVVSGRGGLVPVEQIRRQRQYLLDLDEAVEELAKRKALPEQTEGLVARFLKEFDLSGGREAIYAQRLRWGLMKYYTRHFHPSAADEE